MTIVRELVTMLRYQVDNSGLKNYKEAFEGIAGRMQAGADAVRAAGAGMTQGLRGAIRGAVGDQGALNAAQDASSQKVQKIGQGYGFLRRMIKGAVAAFSVRTVLGYIDSWGQMEARMKSATSSAQEYANADAELARISRLTYKSYSDNAELFVRTRRTMSDLGKSTQDTIDLTESLSLGMALSSTRAENQDSVIGALSKTMVLGKMGAQEYSSIIAGAPRLQVALADGLGVTTDKLLGMVRAGQITSGKMLPALQSQLAKMRIEAESMPVTMADAFTVLNDSAQRFFGKTLTAGRRVVLGITTSIEWLADNIADVAKAAAIAGAAFAFVKARAAIAAASTAAGGLLNAMRAIRTAAWASLGPYLVVAAVLAAIYLIGEDILYWLKGADSVLGDIVGDVSKWKTHIDSIIAPAKQIWATLTEIVNMISRAVMFVANWIAEVVGLQDRFTNFGAVVSAVFGAVLIYIGQLFSVIGSLLSAVVALFKGDWDGVTEHLGAAFEIWKKWFLEMGDFFESIIRGIGKAIGTWILEKIETAKRWVADLFPDWLTGKGTAGANGSVGPNALSGQISPDPARIQSGTGLGSGTYTAQTTNNIAAINVTASNASASSVAAGTQRGIDSALRAPQYGASVPMMEQR